jgi:hypothetical protein
LGSPSVPQAPQYSNFGQANNVYGSSLGAIQGLAGQGQGYTQNILSNPFAGGYQGAAGTAGGQYTALGGNATGASNALYGAGNAALPYASQILQAGFDPQNALYARTQNQVQQQTLAGLAATGTASTPYGAGVLGQTNSNFNIDWQNNQLARESQAASGFGSLLSGAEGAYTSGAAQGGSGAAATLEGGQLPYSTANSINQNDLSALSNQQGLYGTAESGAQGYLGLANQGYQNELSQYQDQYQQNQGIWSGIGSILGGLNVGSSLGNYFNSFLNGSGGDIWAGAGMAA